jgi:hypothetical protein
MGDVWLRKGKGWLRKGEGWLRKAEGWLRKAEGWLSKRNVLLIHGEGPAPTVVIVREMGGYVRDIAE